MHSPILLAICLVLISLDQSVIYVSVERKGRQDFAYFEGRWNNLNRHPSCSLPHSFILWMVVDVLWIIILSSMYESLDYCSSSESVFWAASIVSILSLCIDSLICSTLLPILSSSSGYFFLFLNGSFFSFFFEYSNKPLVLLYISSNLEKYVISKRPVILESLIW